MAFFSIVNTSSGSLLCPVRASDDSGITAEANISRIRMGLTEAGSELTLDTAQEDDAGLLLEPYRTYVVQHLGHAGRSSDWHRGSISGHDTVLAALVAANQRVPGRESPIIAAARERLAPEALDASMEPTPRCSPAPPPSGARRHRSRAASPAAGREHPGCIEPG